MDNLLYMLVLFGLSSLVQYGIAKDSTKSVEPDCKYTFIVNTNQKDACIKPYTNHYAEQAAYTAYYSKQKSSVHSRKLKRRTRSRPRKRERLSRKGRSAKIKEVSRRMEEIASATESYTKHINQLAMQNKNMDDRVTQVYLQLLKEIVEKRDVDLELKRLETELFNKTSQFLELEKNFYKLQAQHERLLRITIQQADNLEKVQKNINGVSVKVNLIQEHSKRQVRRNGHSKKLAAKSKNVESEPDGDQEKTDYPVELPDVKSLQNMSHVQVNSCLTAFQLKGFRENCIVQVNKKPVVCDMKSGGWLVIQQRSSGTVDFFKSYHEYITGFGRLRSDFWIGLEMLYQLTSKKNYKLRIEMYDWKNNQAVAEYESFSVSGSRNGYMLSIAGYSGNAGDSLSIHNNQKFTTHDKDQDPMIQNCADYQRGGWWYNRCADANLNGKYYTSSNGFYSATYQDGVYWASFRGVSYSLKLVQMKIRES